MHHFSKHFLDQMQVRNISMPEVEDVLLNSFQKVMEDELTVYQKVIVTNNQSFLMRVFINENKQPPVAVTVYKTSKIDKYLKS
ncbi:MAG: hypothetical protein JWQ09_4334 [Segetibacter sp.]|nr:hypothetical protein [Segetibacter sp.]